MPQIVEDLTAMADIQDRPAAPAGFAPPEPDLTPDAMVARARALHDRLVEEAPAAEQRGGYSAEMHEAFTQAGFYRLLQPRMFGGYEFGLDTFFRVVLEVAKGDPATGWSLCLASDHVFHIASFFSPEAQAELLGPDGHFCAPHRAAPTGKAEQVPGGYRVTGTWDYCSGVTHATHFIATAMGEHPSRPGEVVPLACVLPRGTYEVLDDWGGGMTLGLQASGSNSVRVDGTVVPAHHVEPYDWKQHDVADGTPGTRLHGNPMYLARTLTMYYGGLASPVLGAALAALEEYEHIMATRSTLLPPRVPRVESPDYQRWLGQVLAWTDSAEALLVGVGERYMERCRAWAERGEDFSIEQDARLRGMLLQVADLSWRSVDLMFATGGTTAAKRGSRLQRCYRDASMYRTHIGAQSDLHLQANAREHLGLPVAL